MISDMFRPLISHLLGGENKNTNMILPCQIAPQFKKILYNFWLLFTVE